MREGFEIVAVNYWKSVNNEIKRILLDFWNTFLLIHDSLDFADIVGFLNKMPNPGKIMYISLTKSNDSMKPHLKDLKSKIFIIDCVSSMIFETKASQDCQFEPTPASLNEMMELIEKYILIVKPDLIVIDSFSQFIDFSSVSMHKGKELYEFLDQLKKKYARTPYRFLLLYDNVLSKDLVNLPFTSVDVILKYEILTRRKDGMDRF
jgi:predicted secreted acid phosphatase